ncbi:MAG TPA: alpha/beta fold hydrolase [Solirubrobacteraceae bacterium]|jgi:pimeloyl-ACP methyl ester carboxylesterase|nr:alpha/beta fold hydrolase [Solirubrobacteraceae bacterium]
MARVQLRAGVALAGAGGLTATAAAAWALERRRYLRRIKADPEYAFLSAPPTGRTVDVTANDGTVLHAEVFGAEGAPTVVLAHGWTEALRLWSHQIADLSRQDFRVVAYDLRGHGQSTKSPAGDYSIATFGDDVEAVLRTCVPADERAVLVGHSLGAMSIAAWAERHSVSERVSAVGMVCTGVVDLLTEHMVFRPPRIPAAVFRPISGYVLGAPGTIPGFSPSILDAVIRYVAFGPTAGPAQIAFYERMLRDCPPDVRAATAAAMSNMNLLGALSRLTVPTLVLAGSRDRLTPPSHARRIADALPAPAEVVELPLSGHMAPLECPDEVSHWLRSLAAGSAAPARSARGHLHAA